LTFISVIGRSVVDFFRDDGLTHSAAMSYFTMMAIVPFCLFLVTLLGYLLGNFPEFYKFFVSRLIYLFPQVTDEITRDISKIVSFNEIGKFGLVLYGLLSFQVFASYEAAVNNIFKVSRKRGLFYSVFISLMIVTLIIAMLIISFAATSFIHILRTFSPPFSAQEIGTITQFIIRFVIPFFLVLFTVMVLYILLPKINVNFRNAFKGAMFTTIFLEIAKHLFTWYIGSIIELGKIYGSLAAFISFLLWVFYSSVIFLIGAEIVHNSEKMKKR
jgi:membrane protein